jgi:hypothetical protein
LGGTRWSGRFANPTGQHWLDGPPCGPSRIVARCLDTARDALRQ